MKSYAFAIYVWIVILLQMKTDINSSADKIIQQLETTKKEIEQFLDELNLDELKAEDHLKKIKGELKSSIKEIRATLLEKNITEAEATIQSKLSELQEHLDKSEDAPNDIDLFLNTIKTALKEVVTLIDNNPISEILEKVHDRLLLYKLKFEIIKLKLAMGKLKVKYTGKEIQHQLTRKIHAISEIIRESKQEATDKLKKFRQMTTRVYSDISKLYT